MKRPGVRAASAALAAAAIAVVIARRAPETTQGFAPRGPSVGEALPRFEAADQNGRAQTFESLRGPRGLVLVFLQSADW